MHRSLCIFLVLCWTAGSISAADSRITKFISPDKRFALRMTKPAADVDKWKVDLIEKTSGKVFVGLGTVFGAHLSETVLVWSADSKRAAYGSRSYKDGEVSVFFLQGSTFEEATLPEELPSPDINFGKGGGGDVKNYGGAVTPLRWLKSGDLELSSDSMMLSRDNGRSYTGMLVFTLAFDAKHHATVH